MSTSRMSCVTSASDGLHPNDRTTVPRSLVAILPSLSMSKREKHACASGKIGVVVKKIAHRLSHFIFLSVIVTERHNYITCLLCPRRNQQFFWMHEKKRKATGLICIINSLQLAHNGMRESTWNFSPQKYRNNASGLTYM